MDLPRAKRLRGHQLDLEKQNCKPLAKGAKAEKSGLVTKLLSLWAHGQLSATLCQQLAHLAVLDGAKHEELIQMASAGNWGQVSGNCHRDFMSTHCKKNALTKAHEVDVQVRDPKTSKVGVETASLYLPHMLFADLATSYPEQFDKNFGCSELAGFWKNVEAVKDERLQGHPICLDKRQGLAKRHVVNADKTVPLFIHADGVEFQTRDTIMCWNWGGLLSQFSSLQSHMLICAFPKSCTMESTWTPIMKYIKWSLESLQDGFHPCVGPDNEPLPKGSMFDKLAGTPLTPQGFKGVVWSIQGDHEMYSLVLGLPHWNSKFPCWECDCQQPLTKGEPCPEGKSFKLLREEEQAFEYLSHAEALTKGMEQHPLFQIEGLSTKMVRHDGLHVLFAKGVCSHLCGSILHVLCYLDGKGKQSVKPSDRLALIFSQVQEQYKKQKTATRLTNLKLSMVCDVKKPHKEYPKLDCKAAECKHFMPALLPVIKAMLDSTDEVHQHIVHALSSMVDLIKLFDDAGMFLDKRTYSKARKLARQFFSSYSWLNEWAEEADRYLFHITMKFHTCGHMIQSSCDINPRCCWNFRSEDFVGRMSTLGSSVVHGVKSTRLCCKINDKYQVLLHLQLDRLGFGNVHWEPSMENP